MKLLEGKVALITGAARGTALAMPLPTSSPPKAPILHSLTSRSTKSTSPTSTVLPRKLLLMASSASAMHRMQPILLKPKLL